MLIVVDGCRLLLIVINAGEELGPIKQTKQHKYISKMMGTPVPFLPFCGNKEENKCFSKYVCEHNGPINDERAAVDWCQYVEGVSINAKTSAHIRNHLEFNGCNQRIKETNRKNKTGAELLAKLHQQIAPVVLHAGATKHITSLLSTTDA